MDWTQRLQTMQGNNRGVPKQGSSAPVPYAPGMMKMFSGNRGGVPSARALAQASPMAAFNRSPGPSININLPEQPGPTPVAPKPQLGQIQPDPLMIERWRAALQRDSRTRSR